MLLKPESPTYTTELNLKLLRPTKNDTKGREREGVYDISCKSEGVLHREIKLALKQADLQLVRNKYGVPKDENSPLTVHKTLHHRRKSQKERKLFLLPIL